MVVDGIKYQLNCSGLGLGYTVTRFFYFSGYSFGDPKGSLPIGVEELPLDKIGDAYLLDFVGPPGFVQQLSSKVDWGCLRLRLITRKP
nr:microsomal glutathione S-transferase 3-like [Tanacetum cinerariifolium]